MPPAVRDLQSVQIERRSRSDAETPVVTLTARVALGTLGDVRVTARPLVAIIADVQAQPRAEIHAEGGTSVVIEGPPLATLFRESVQFLRDKASGATKEHDAVFGVTATFDLATGPFVTLEQPPFLVAHARTMIHPSGSVALRILGELRTRERAAHHAPARPGEAAEREAFDLQIGARRAEWLAKVLDSALSDLAPST